MQTAFIVEDELPALNRVKKLLNVYVDDLSVVGTAQNGQSAIQAIEVIQPDLLFLDIQLPDMTGFNLLSQLTYQPLVIFTTAYTNYAIQSFDTYVIDYLVKPFDAQRFEKAIDKFKKFAQSRHTTDTRSFEQAPSNQFSRSKPFALPIKIGNRIKLIDFEDIVYLKAEDKYIRVFTNSGREHLSEKSLRKLEEQLPAYFIRVHRSYIVNRTYIQEIQKYFKGNLIIQMNDFRETSIITGTKYVAGFKAKLGI